MLVVPDTLGIRPDDVRDGILLFELATGVLLILSLSLVLFIVDEGEYLPNDSLDERYEDKLDDHVPGTEVENRLRVVFEVVRVVENVLCPVGLEHDLK